MCPSGVLPHAMTSKSILIVLVAMSGSYTTIHAVLGYDLGPDVLSGARTRQARTSDRVAVAPPGPQLRRPPEAEELYDEEADRRLRGIPDVPDTPSPLSDIPGPLPPPAARKAEIDALARVTERRLQGVERALTRQVKALKQSRDEMLVEFAGQLAAMSVAEASAELSALDDETAALTLGYLGAARRGAILRTLKPQRRTAIEKIIRRLPAR